MKADCLITKREVARRLNTSERHVELLTYSRRIPSVRLGHRTVRFDVSLRLGRQNPRYDAAQIDEAMRDPQYTLRGRAPKLQVLKKTEAA